MGELSTLSSSLYTMPKGDRLLNGSNFLPTDPKCKIRQSCSLPIMSRQKSLKECTVSAVWNCPGTSIQKHIACSLEIFARCLSEVPLSAIVCIMAESNGPNLANFLKITWLENS